MFVTLNAAVVCRVEVIVGLVSRTILFPVPEEVPERATAKVPEVVIGFPDTENRDGIVRSTEVTVPTVGVVQVIVAPVPPDVRT